MSLSLVPQKSIRSLIPTVNMKSIVSNLTKNANLILIAFLVISLLSCNNSSKTETRVTKEELPTPQPKENVYNVGFLIMDGTFNTELTAPFDIFQHTKYREGIQPMNVFLVAQTMDAVTTFEGIRILPDYTFDNAPNIDILVVPSAEHHLDTDLENATMINFVKQVSKNAMYITSHCDGAFVLAQAGILDQKVSTTFPSDIDQMKDRFPQLDIRKNVWFVHDDKVITSAGGARSFEAAMYLCDVLYGPEITQSLAGGLVLDYELDKYPHLIIESKKAE